MPDDESEAAKQGTRAHGWGEKVLLGQAKIQEVPKTYRPGVKLFVDYVVDLKVPVLSERKFYSLEIDDCFGTIDTLAIIDDDRGAIVDFKFGRMPVKADGNQQLLTYAMLADEYFSLAKWKLAIIQPRASSGPRVKEWIVSKAMIDAHREVVKVAAKSNVKQTGEHCRGCPLRKFKMCAEGVELGQRMGWGDGKW
jgi:hypothetical protein